MNWCEDMNKLIGPRNAAEAHGVTLAPGHTCTHTCRMAHGVGYHSQCVDRHACAMDLPIWYQEAAPIDPAAWNRLTRCPWDDWKPGKDVA